MLLYCYPANIYFGVKILEESIVLKNGIPIYFYPNKHLHGFCLCLYIKAGAMYETDELNGSTHIWEHMLFRKLNRIYQGDFYKMLDMLGLSFSASTYKEFVSVRITGAAEYFDEAVKILPLVFEPHNLTLGEINLEKKRIKSEKREGAEDSSLDRFTQKIIWANTSLANSIIGNNKIIDRLGVRALRDVHDQICSLGNMFFYITGCFSQEGILLLSKYVESYRFSENEIHQNIAPVPEKFFKRNGQIEIKNNYYDYIRFSFDIDITKYSYAELDLLFDILFSGDNSKIFIELSENTGYIYDFDARLERYLNLGSLYFSFEISKKNILPAIKKVIDVLRGLKTYITDELSCVLPQYVDNAELDLDNNERLNWNMAYECHIMQNTYKSIEEKKNEYIRVTPTRIMEIAKEIFTQNNMVITLKTNKRVFKLEEAYAITKKL